jgi:hypothetical protein
MSEDKGHMRILGIKESIYLMICIASMRRFLYITMYFRAIFTFILSYLFDLTNVITELSLCPNPHHVDNEGRI